MRGGTSALFEALAQHPQVPRPSRKEIHFFDIHFGRGTRWYRAFFPVGRARSIDISPSYMNHELAARRVASTIPDAKILVLLREPAERAWSHYRKRIKEGTEYRDFAAAIQSELALDVRPLRLFRKPAEIPYLSAGLYAEQLIPWIQEFGRENLFIAGSEQLFSSSARVLADIQTFALLPVVPLPFTKMNAAPTESLPGIIDDVREFYAKPNRRLRELLDVEIGWL